MHVVRSLYFECEGRLNLQNWLFLHVSLSMAIIMESVMPLLCMCIAFMHKKSTRTWHPHTRVHARTHRVSLEPLSDNKDYLCAFIQQLGHVFLIWLLDHSLRSCGERSQRDWQDYKEGSQRLEGTPIQHAITLFEGISKPHGWNVFNGILPIEFYNTSIPNTASGRHPTVVFTFLDSLGDLRNAHWLNLVIEVC